eukprot:gnl/TRDRNA2_/TRDRNA2_27441_c0_seq1.p1 gnl/TRDRNA2_/TRDRNA2_27441_c0~~gnl/TRDRNA2_/TRDRNA2_27441_c0_seq1.p1  ORF type:complete len:459 (+),score=47.67 gnl/TRDRNA2_/TRDRNA2_27441_c0_seq1:130-1506(+)
MCGAFGPTSRPGESSGVCARLEPLGVFDQIGHDLERYRKLSGQQAHLYRGFCARHRRACITLRVVRGAAFVIDLWPGYQSRHLATLHAIHRSLQRFGPVPDVEVVIDVTDGELHRVDLPIFVITHRTKTPMGILYPDFTFFNWPESACPPAEPSHSHSHLLSIFGQNWTHGIAPWRSRADSVFWRGARVGDRGIRDSALRHLSDVPGADARYVAWQAVSVTGLNHVPGCVGLTEQCRHRFLPFLAGTTYSSRFKYQLLCGSTVLAAEPEWAEWWTQLLRPGEHYAHVSPDWSDVAEVLRGLRKSPEEARALAESGQRFALAALSADAADCYWWRLLAAASAVLPRAAGAGLPARARPLEDVLLWPDNVALSADTGGVIGGPPVTLVPPPWALHDPRCFEDGSMREWARCCDVQTFGPNGDDRCWGASTGEVFDFRRCCLSGGDVGESRGTFRGANVTQ